VSVDDRSSGAPIGLHVEDQIATVTLYRPQVLNAVDRSMAMALAETFDILESDGDVRAVVVTGAGEKAFCVGADLKEASQPGRRVRVKGGFASLTDRSFPKPLIAAVNGLALGGGAEICLACDLIVAEEHARFGFPEVRRGLFAGAGGLERLPTRIPATIAMELFLTGREIGAERACELGLVNALYAMKWGSSLATSG
jgi:enoyl-CoA hydratase/carnithine racemase